MLEIDAYRCAACDQYFRCEPLDAARGRVIKAARQKIIFTPNRNCSSVEACPSFITSIDKEYVLGSTLASMQSLAVQGIIAGTYTPSHKEPNGS